MSDVIMLNTDKSNIPLCQFGPYMLYTSQMLRSPVVGVCYKGKHWATCRIVNTINTLITAVVIVVLTKSSDY